MTSSPERIVVAFGGNAITGPDDTGEIHQQFYHARLAIRGIAPLIRAGASVVLTHGNGPQVGAAMRRMEIAMGSEPPRPLGVLVADSQGGIGYMIAQSLRNWLRREGMDRVVVPMITQVVVSPDDPAMRHPTKPIGLTFGAERAEQLRALGWKMAGDDRKGYRRLVPSPEPIRIVEARPIRHMMNAGYTVIACGGGGIPVCETDHGDIDGVDAVIDKDLVSALLASEVEAHRLVILTQVPHVMLGYGSPDPRPIHRMTVAQAQAHLAAGEFPPGTMGPKVTGAAAFVERGGGEALITSFEGLPRALEGEGGTRIVP